MKIFLHGGTLTERGTTRALIDYAKYLEIYENYSIKLVFPKSNVDFEKYNKLIKLISQNNEILFYKNLNELKKTLLKEDADFFYTIKGGDYDGLCYKEVRTLTHAVFQVFQPHGHRYAYNSEWIANKMSTRFVEKKLRSYLGSSIYGRIQAGRKSLISFNKIHSDYRICDNKFAFDYVPHIVEMPKVNENLRKVLGISEEAFVFGAMAGGNEFNLEFVKLGIEKFLQKFTNSYFVGVNIEPFMSSERAIFLPPIYDQESKARYLSSLDLFINARAMGESFGLAICESLFQGVPVIAWSGGSDKNQVQLLGKEEWIYDDINSFLNKLQLFSKGKTDGIKYNIKAESIVKQFHPRLVIDKFLKVFLK
jgi:glycosyltransferase involved in cell wall biosynthesis